jgi:hypothetical protein
VKIADRIFNTEGFQSVRLTTAMTWLPEHANAIARIVASTPMDDAPDLETARRRAASQGDRTRRTILAVRDGAICLHRLHNIAARGATMATLRETPWRDCIAAAAQLVLYRAKGREAGAILTARAMAPWATCEPSDTDLLADQVGLGIEWLRATLAQTLTAVMINGQKMLPRADMALLVLANVRLERMLAADMDWFLTTVWTAGRETTTTLPRPEGLHNPDVVWLGSSAHQDGDFVTNAIAAGASRVRVESARNPDARSTCRFDVPIAMVDAELTLDEEDQRLARGIAMAAIGPRRGRIIQSDDTATVRAWVDAPGEANEGITLTIERTAGRVAEEAQAAETMALSPR